MMLSTSATNIKRAAGHLSSCLMPMISLNFMSQIFCKDSAFILDKRKNSILVIAGDGPLRFDLEEKARKLSISDHVIFLGPRRDIPELLMAFDSFVLPSQYEGLGIALVEAMASGLPCIFTDSIPSEVNLIPSLIHRISLNDDNNVWAETIIEATPLEERKNGSLIVKDRGYDIKETAKELQDFYLKISSS